MWAFAQDGQSNISNFYRPIQIVLYTLGYAIGGLSPTPYHAINLLFHTLASLMVFAVCLELGFAGPLALLGGALFAAHPIHTEAVAWIAATPEVTCGFLYFAALWAFLRSGSGAHRPLWILSAALFFVALLSKEMAITLPAVALMLTLRPHAKPISWTRRIVLMVPYGVATVAYFALRIRALGFVATSAIPQTASYLDWITLGIRALGQYVWLAVVPYPIVAYRMIQLHFVDRMIPTLACLVLIVALGALAWKDRSRIPEAGVWFAAFFLMLTPVFYFKGISSSFVSDRYLYIPSLAPIVIALAWLQRSKSQTWTWVAWGCAGVFAFLALIRTQDWKSPERLYSVTLAQEPNVAEFHAHLAKRLMRSNQPEPAIQHLKEALRLAENSPFAQSYKLLDAHISLTGLLMFTNRLDEAAEHLRLAEQADPNSEMVLVDKAALGMLRNPPDYAGAVEPLTKAIAANPYNEISRDYLGMALFNLGRVPEAIAAFQASLNVDPTYDLARQHLAIATQAASR